MSAANYLLAIDQGTTSTRAILYRRDLSAAHAVQREFPQSYPRSGWVEHDPEDLWQTTVETSRDVLREAAIGAEQVAAIGITNQRETTLVWDRKTGKAIHPAIVWQDRRTAALCREMRDAGDEREIHERTGLVLDPYFSGTKAAWILDHVEGAREAAERGALAFGTVDSFLLYRLTGGRVHATDATNASRTLLYDIHRGAWSEELCRLLRVPMSMLPEVRDCCSDFGETDAEIFGARIPVLGIAGDQQAAIVGQACFTPGMVKATYGTGCFALLNTGDKPVNSSHRLLTTIAYQIDGKPAYALEGSIFVAGAAVQWLRDGLGVIRHAKDTGELASRADPHQDVYLVPAFVGLGAPYWDPDCRGAIFGLTRGTGPAEFARAALEAVCYQTRDLLEAMHGDWQEADGSILRIDGGMTSSDWMNQRLADLLALPVERPQSLETTALGAAYLAGRQAGICPDLAGFAAQWSPAQTYQPRMDAETREAKYAGWQDAVRRTRVASD